jgi:hypothetical protein
MRAMRTSRPYVARWTSIGFLIVLSGLSAWAADLPAGWFAAGSHPAEYQMGIDATVRRDGKSSGFIKATASELHGFGTLMQTAAPGEYLGKRIRLSGFVRSEKVQSGWAGLWLRIDGPIQSSTKQPEMLGFDNMQGRPIKGNTDWTRHEIVLDVPGNAVALAYGVLLAGDGAVWLDGLKFEVVPASVRVTGTNPASPNRAPQNLDFEKE